MSSSEGIQVASKVYRNLLKAVRKNIGKEEQKAHFVDFIKQEFRSGNGGQPAVDPSSIRQKLNLARDYTFLLNSVHHHKDLLFSYNIAVDRSDEMKRILGKSAASVGLQLPEVYQS
ncbi:OLC1v1001312C1 [Oldenlandia corymbosa var. corymbosa]|uniref:OLC1v1001312C1 n=1 Tax=Oldenlandia corymbosa var. corymbosa TaxID=529605 RepID=A0AAV1D591_OLDCO|nr:OLC1v1001312C1 [Oldenlandia corymbosa var. corymbosa]